MQSSVIVERLCYFTAVFKDLMFSTVKHKTSRLANLFTFQLESWANELKSMDSTVLAISRKGPRLIELLIYEGFLPNTFREQVISELALPFMKDHDGKMVVIDDSVSNGTTFNKIHALSTEASKKWSNFDEIVGLPFGVGEKVKNECLDNIDKYFLPLKQNEITSFVNSEVIAFQLLGKPFDLEYPILSVLGDFDNENEIESVLEKVALKLEGEVIPLNMQVSTADEAISSKSWTLTLNRESDTTQSIAKPEFKKIRVYLNQTKNKLNITAMQPVILSKNSFAELEKALPAVLKDLWLMAYETVYETFPEHQLSELFNGASRRSLCMWANFLNSMLLLATFKKEFFEAMANIGKDDFDWNGPNEYDLQLLIGRELAVKSEKLLSGILQEGFTIEVQKNIFLENLREKFSEEDGERIPKEYENQYESKLEELTSAIEDINVDDTLRAIFHAQHHIEVLSRENSDSKRLDFGLTYRRLISVIREYVPDAKEAVINFCFDRLIDEGCIVPRYINMSDSRNPIDFWVRAFRVGEATVPKPGLVNKFLFDSINRAYKNDDLIPEFLMEKFCVLVLLKYQKCNNIANLLNGAELDKDYDVKGARCVINPCGTKREFLLEWAVRNNIFIKEDLGYKLDPKIDYRIESNDTPIDDDTKDAVDDMAMFVSLIYGNEELRTKALTLLTSVASKQELQKAIREELRLWIYGNSSIKSIKSCLQSISILVGSEYNQDFAEDARSKIDNLLSVMKEVDSKREINQNRNEIFSLIDEEVEKTKSTPLMRLWRNLKKDCDSLTGSDKKFSENPRITCIKELADLTNDIVDKFLVLLEADSDNIENEGFSQSIAFLKNFILQESDPVVFDKSSDDGVNYCTFIGEKVRVISDLEARSPQEIFLHLKPAISKISELCETIWTDFSDVGEFIAGTNRYGYVLMWDKIESTNVNSVELRQCIESTNRQINRLGSQIEYFNSSLNDGNRLICKQFRTVISVFEIIVDGFKNVIPSGHRFGCHYSEITPSEPRQEFEYSGRIMDFFEEIKKPNIWGGDESSKPEKPESSYLIISEAAKRRAEGTNTWKVSRYTINSPPETYKIRLHGGEAPEFPISIVTRPT
jgi:hypothetical protein